MSNTPKATKVKTINKIGETIAFGSFNKNSVAVSKLEISKFVWICWIINSLIVSCEPSTVILQFNIRSVIGFVIKNAKTTLPIKNNIWSDDLLRPLISPAIIPIKRNNAKTPIPTHITIVAILSLLLSLNSL